MIRTVAKSWLAMIGIGRIMRFKPGWAETFDVSSAGFRHSFFAALLSLPLLIFIMMSSRHIGSDATLGPALVVFGLSWLVFPLSAALVCRVMGTQQGFVPWVVVHNWAVLGLYLLQAVLWALRVAELIDTGFLIFFLQLYLYIRVLVHWRVAYVTLGLPTISSALAAAVPILVVEIVYLAVYRIMVPQLG